METGMYQCLDMKQTVSDLLKDEFKARCKANPLYSLRSFSRDIQVSPSFLSEILRGKKRVSPDKALSISKALGWSWREMQIFLQTAQLGQAKSKRAKNFLTKEIKRTEVFYGRFKNLRARQFSLISNWYFMAILELTGIAGFQDDPSWVSKKLGISARDAEDALSQLKKKRLIYQNKEGRWEKTINASVKDAPSSDIQKFHLQHLSNAAEAIREQEFHQRHFSGVTMAVDPNKLPQAIELIGEFRSRMSGLLEQGQKEKVYHLAIQLFQLDNENLKNTSGVRND